MNIRQIWSDQNNTWHISLAGEIDIYNAPELKNNLLKLVEQNKGDIQIDCSDLKYIDSTGLGVLISALRRVKDYNGTIMIKNLQPYIYKIFTITGLDKVFTIEVQE
ncbi:MAG: STAS domain-containing protein [Caldicoprobacterales bacterium]|jgi:anti-sigma B factor antagonist|nr:STAS domain-containing protein [Clostridiales bacterium]